MVMKYKLEESTHEFNAISRAVGFWILDAYYRMGSSLRLRGSVGEKYIDCPAGIESTTSIDSRIWIKLFGESDPLNPEKKLCLSVIDADFRFDPVGGRCSKTGEILNSSLEITPSLGDLLVIEENFPPKNESKMH